MFEALAGLLVILLLIYIGIAVAANLVFRD